MKLTKLASAVLALSLFAPLAAPAQDAMVKGEVKKVDAAGGKITMTSGPINKFRHGRRLHDDGFSRLGSCDVQAS